MTLLRSGIFNDLPQWRSREATVRSIESEAYIMLKIPAFGDATSMGYLPRRAAYKM